MDSIRVAKVENVTLIKANARTTGTLHLTPHHLIFTASSSTTQTDPTSPELQSTETWIPYPHISHLSRLPLTIQNASLIELRTKLFERYVFEFPSGRDRDAEDVWCSVKELGVVPSIDRLHAFAYRPPSPSPPSQQALRSHATHVLSSTSHSDNGAPESVPGPSTRRGGRGHVPLMTDIFEAESSPSSSNFPPESSFHPSEPISVPSTSLDSMEPQSTDPLPPTPPLTNGWQIYNPRTEFARMGVGTRTRAWRFTDVNREYAFSPTYPAKLVVPSKISDAVLMYAGKYRSKARIPALTYLHWANQATITRCSQPLVGFKGARSPQDERLVDSIFTSHLSAEANFGDSSIENVPSGSMTPRRDPGVAAGPLSTSGSAYGAQTAPVYGATATNLIVDARPTTNAMANVAVGAGTEKMENYKGARKAYLGIDNIHVMRDSLHRVVAALKESDSSSSGSIDKHALRRSNWLKHISNIMEGSLMIVRNIHINSSHVLIHCSDGWDRTAQLSATAQICLDPFYRTIAGLEILIEKDWMSFGHKFLDRSGHLGSEKAFETMPQPDDEFDDSVGATEKAAQAFFKSVSNKFASSGQSKEVSPVFQQFLDCVHQIQRQYPERFEYNGVFLETILYHVYSCQFGTFISNNERQRRTAPTEAERDQEGFSTLGIISEMTAPVWDWLNEPQRVATYCNEAYNPTLDKADAKNPDSDMGVLLPDAKDVRFWHELFHHADDDMNGRRVILEQVADAPFPGASMPFTPGQEDPVADAGPIAIAQSVTAVALDETGLTDSSSRAALGSGAWHNVNAQSGPARSNSTDARPRSGSGVNDYIHSAARNATASASKSSRGGWGWAQLSSGALNAISVAGRELNSAAKEIKNISSEAFTNYAASEDDGGGGELMEGSERLGSRGGSRPPGRSAVGEAVDPWGNPILSGPPHHVARDSDLSAVGRPSRSGRFPSETNPWTSTTNRPVESHLSVRTTTPNEGPLPARPGPRLDSEVDYMAAPSSTWGSVANRKSAKALSPARYIARMDLPVDSMSNEFAGTHIDDTKQQKQNDNWDPLGAL